MARTTEEIQQEILTEKTGNSELNVLDSPSNIAIWKIWTFIIATVIHVHEKLWDLFRTEINEIKNKAVAGTPLWYVDKAKSFQFGDPVIIDPDTFQVTYETIDESKQIIKRAAISSSGRISTLKVATEDLSGDPVKLSVSELTAFKVYMNEKVQFAGAQINVISNDADLLKLQAIIYYNGLLDLTQVRIDTEAAIKSYLANIDFDGRFLRNKLIDGVQALGSDVDINVLEAKIAGGNYAVVDRSYNTLSGYLTIDPTFPLSANLTYVAE